MVLSLRQALPYLGGFLGAVALATAAFGGGMWYKGQLPQPEPSPQTQPQQESCQDCVKPFPAPDTSNWKSYRNEELEFEVKYPRGLEVEEEKLIQPPIMKLDPKTRKLNVFTFVYKEALNDKPLFLIQRYEDNTLGSLDYLLPESVLQETLQKIREGDYSDTRLDIRHQISGLPGGKVIWLNSGGNELPDFGFTQYFVDYKGNHWTFDFYINPELYLNWTDTVVSTFRFID